MDINILVLGYSILEFFKGQVPFLWGQGQGQRYGCLKNDGKNEPCCLVGER